LQIFFDTEGGRTLFRIALPEFAGKVGSGAPHSLGTQAHDAKLWIYRDLPHDGNGNE